MPHRHLTGIPFESDHYNFYLIGPGPEMIVHEFFYSGDEKTKQLDLARLNGLKITIKNIDIEIEEPGDGK